MEDFVTYEITLKLKEKGFKEKCLFAYNDEQVINPKVIEEYGNLTDDGYYELTEDGGGKLKFDNVYIYEQQIILRDKIIIERNFIDAPTISQVLKYLREKYSIHISTKPYPCEDGLMWHYEIRKFNQYISAVVANKTGFTKEEYAALDGIEYVLDNLI